MSVDDGKYPDYKLSEDAEDSTKYEELNKSCLSSTWKYLNIFCSPIKCRGANWWENLCWLWGNKKLSPCHLLQTALVSASFGSRSVGVLVISSLTVEDMDCWCDPRELLLYLGRLLGKMWLVKGCSQNFIVIHNELWHRIIPHGSMTRITIFSRVEIKHLFEKHKHHCFPEM